MKPKITILTNCRITISALECAGIGSIAKTTINLAPHAGERVRIWLDRDGTYSLDKYRDHFWQIAELDVPARVRQSSETIGEDGKVETTETISPPDLSGVEVLTWPLPE